MNEPVDLLSQAKTYTKKYLSKTKEYKDNNGNDYYHIVQFAHYLASKTKLSKDGRDAIQAFISKTSK